MADQENQNPFRVRWFQLVVLATVLATGRPATPANTAGERPFASEAEAAERGGILWQDPLDLTSRNLFYGIGGAQHAPPAQTYTFVEEDLGNSSPKFVVKDSNGVRWKVKLGSEAQGEIAATRLVWAAGYFTDEDYYLPQLRVDEMPLLKRGKDLVSSEGVVENVRMEREIQGQKKVGYWKWKGQQWPEQRAFNGLRIMMALINNWDLKDNNNAIYSRQTPGAGVEYIYAVGDLGASFGSTHLDRQETKSNLEFYEASQFIGKVGPERVRFATPGAPTVFLLVNPFDYFYRRRLMSVTHGIPRDDARWIGQLLSGLSGQQIRDAFRAGGFPAEEADRFAQVVERRIETLRGM